MIALSICIPTYNRSEYLQECLTSVLTSTAEHASEVEIVISDNASTDATGDIVRTFQEAHPWIRYHRNEENIGGERNFYLLATLAKGENIWVFGDDDKMEERAVARVLDNIRAGYCLTICNYSQWDKHFVVQLKKCGLPGDQDQTFKDPNEIMKRFGLNLSYISSVVIKKSLFLKITAEEYEYFMEYGLSFLFAVYNGIQNGNSKVRFISEPIFCNRSGNSGDYDWYKYFVTGTSLIFDELLHKGYKKDAVFVAKQALLTDFVTPSIFGLRLKLSARENCRSLAILNKHFKSHWQFWVFCVPRFLVPSFLLLLAKKMRHTMRFLIYY